MGHGGLKGPHDLGRSFVGRFPSPRRPLKCPAIVRRDDILGDNNSVGAAWVFQLSGGSWTQFGGKINGNDAVGAARQGPVALSTDGSVLLLGGPGDHANVGAIWLFNLSRPGPILTGINPSSALAEGAGFTLTITGLNFRNGASILWNNSPLSTAFVNSSQLTATVASYLISSTGTASVSVVNPDGGTTANATFTINGAILTVTSTHFGDFLYGQNGGIYTFVVSNAAGALATTGAVTVTPDFPVGLTAASMSGQGWTCTSSCTRSDSLLPGTSYPPISLTVNVAQNAATLVCTAVRASGGGGYSGVYDPTKIVAFSPCDINTDGSTNVTDIHTIMNEALGKAAPVHFLGNNEKVGVLDVQMVIGSVLGRGCGAI